MIERSLLAAGCLLAALGLAVPAPAAAQSITSPYDFVDGRHAFYAIGARVFTDRGTVDTGPGTGYAAALGYNLRISGPFNLGARVTYFPTDRRVYTDNSTAADSVELRADPMTGLEQVGTANLSLLLLDVSLRFDLTGPRTWHRIQPYVVMGAGGAIPVSYAQTGEEELPEDLELRVRFRRGFTGHVGGGIEIYLSEHFTARVDARDLLWKLHVPVDFLTTGRVIDSEQWVQTGHVSLGLSLRF